jgi:hypothetical protein
MTSRIAGRRASASSRSERSPDEPNRLGCGPIGGRRTQTEVCAPRQPQNGLANGGDRLRVRRVLQCSVDEREWL